MMRKLFGVLFFFCALPVFAAGGATMPLLPAHIKPTDQASLQRGAKLYMNYCMGCHALGHMRYKGMGRDIGLVDEQGHVAEALLKKNLIFTEDKTGDLMRNAMIGKEAARWFGVAPPDLTLVARVRGVDWLYTYLLNFYDDASKPWGTNNRLFPDVAMPNVLRSLQGAQAPLYREEMKKVGADTQSIKTIERLQLQTHGDMDTIQFHTAVRDLVNFLAYAGEPARAHRIRLGQWVLLFLGLFALLTYWLKKEYWKDVQ